MKIKIIKFILKDESSNDFDDLITFDNAVELDEVKKAIDKVKKDLVGEYTNDDIYNGIDTLGVSYNIQWLGCLETIEY